MHGCGTLRRRWASPCDRRENSRRHSAPARYQSEFRRDILRVAAGPPLSCRHCSGLECDIVQAGSAMHEETHRNDPRDVQSPRGGRRRQAGDALSQGRATSRRSPGTSWPRRRGRRPRRWSSWASSPATASFRPRKIATNGSCSTWPSTWPAAFTWPCTATLTGPQIAWQIDNSGAKLVVVSGAGASAKAGGRGRAASEGREVRVVRPCDGEIARPGRFEPLARSTWPKLTEEEGKATRTGSCREHQARRSGHDSVHLGHDRRTQGRDAVASQPDVELPGRDAGLSRSSRATCG